MRAPLCSAARSLSRASGKLSMWIPSLLAKAGAPTSAAMDSTNETKSFFIPCPLVRREDHAVGNGFELAGPAPPRHQEEEREIQQRAGLRHVREPRRWLLRAEVTEDKKHEHEREQKAHVPAGA